MRRRILGPDEALAALVAAALMKPQTPEPKLEPPQGQMTRQRRRAAARKAKPPALPDQETKRHE